MPVTLDDVRSSTARIATCESVEQELIDIINSRSLNLKELIIVLAQMLVDVGGTLEGVNTRLTFSEMWRRYATEPTLGNALMAQGADILHDWLLITEKNDEEEERKE